MSNIATGTYTIRSVTQKDGENVGRPPVENLSDLLPKRVIAVGSNVAPPKWFAARLPGLEVILKVNDADTHAVDGVVFVDLINIDPTLWILFPQFDKGFNVYTIVEANNDSVGWVFQGPTAGAHVVSKTLSGNNNPEELWVVEPASN